MIRLFTVITLLLSGAIALAADFPDKAGIYLLDAKQAELKIGEITFTDSGQQSTAIAVNIDTSVFTDHFLSMRPFRCLESSTEWFCYLEYPYELRSLITTDDLSDLEYQLLFIRKKPSEFGIDAWNGLYYKLELQDDGSITGDLLEGDLNSLQSPPAEQYAKPVDLSEFIDGDKAKRLYPKVRIF